VSAISPDVRIRQLVAARDLRAAATEAIQYLGPDVLRFLRSLLRDEDEAGDAFSQFAESLWRDLGSFRGDAPLRNWAFRLAYHAAISLKRQAWRRYRRRLTTGEVMRIAEELRTKTYERVERQRSAMDQLCEALSIEERMLLNLRIEQNLSWAEIADVMAASGTPVDPATLTKRFERLKAKLTLLAKEHGFTSWGKRRNTPRRAKGR
jgi:RNA polymerase sigma-70 factor (ECF subfamily)